MMSTFSLDLRFQFFAEVAGTTMSGPRIQGAMHASLLVRLYMNRTKMHTYN
jgi:hypothetical protein